MVKEIILTLVAYYGMMIGAAVHGVKHDALIFIRSERISAGAVGYLRLFPTERTRGIRHIVNTVALVYPYGFKETLRSLDYAYLTIIRHHILIETDATDRILPCKEVRLPIIVDEDARVDEVSVAYHARTVYRKQGATYRIGKRSVGSIADGNADMLLVGGVIEVVSAIAKDTIRSPRLRLSPRCLGQGIEYHAAILPMLHVCSTIYMIVFHRERERIITVMTRIYPQSVAKHPR